MPKAKRTLQPPGDPIAVFCNAGFFHEAASVLMKAEKSGNASRALAVPASANLAFSCELYLKCLLFIEAKKVQAEHHLKLLFDGLEISTQEAIVKAWNASILKMVSTDQKSMAENHELDLVVALQRYGKAFEVLRYVYDASPDQIEFGMYHLGDVLRKFIFSIKPEWSDSLREMNFNRPMPQK